MADDWNCAQIPLRLRPVGQLRSHHIYFKFTKKVKPTIAEKLFLAEEFNEVHSFLEPTAERTGAIERHTFAGLAKRYGLKDKTVWNWTQKLHSPETSAFHPSAGRPLDIDIIGVQKIKDAIKEGKSAKKKKPVVASSLPLMLKAEKLSTAERRGKHALDPDDVDVSINTTKRFKRKHQITKRKPKDETKARDVAERSIRCTYKFSLMLEAFAGNKPAELKFNADATQYECKASGSGDFALVINGEVDSRDEVVSQEYPTELSAFLKHVQLANAAGKTGELVVVIAVPKLPVGKFYVERIAGFAQDGAVDSRGWLFACSSRSGNDELWNYWIVNCLIPTIVAAQKAYEDTVSILLALSILFSQYFSLIHNTFPPLFPPIFSSFCSPLEPCNPNPSSTPTARLSLSIRY